MPKKLALALLALALEFPAAADFYDGVKAYDRGDYDSAFKMFLEAAEKNDDVAAARNVAHFYRLGLGVDKDLPQALFWYKKAADAGLARAQHNLALMYLEGEGTAKNDSEAVAWLFKAAASGHAESKDKLRELGIDFENNSSYIELSKNFTTTKTQVAEKDGGVNISLASGAPVALGENYDSFDARHKVGATPTPAKPAAKAAPVSSAAATAAAEKSFSVRAHVQSYREARQADKGFLELSSKFFRSGR